MNEQQRSQCYRKFVKVLSLLCSLELLDKQSFDWIESSKLNKYVSDYGSL